MSIQSTAPLSACYALIRDPKYAMQTVPPWCAWKVQCPQHGRPLPRMFLPTQHLCKMPGEISTDRIHKDTMPMFNTYLASCFLLSAVTKYTNCMDGTLTMVVWSRDNCVPPKNTGNACASHVAGLNMTGNVKFTWPDKIYCVWAEKKKLHASWAKEYQNTRNMQHLIVMIMSIASRCSSILLTSSMI